MIKQFSGLLGPAVQAIRVAEETPPWEYGPPVYIEQRWWHYVQILKQIAKGHIIRTPFVGISQRSQKAALRQVLKGLDSWIDESPRFGELPDSLASLLRDIGPRGDRASHTGFETRRAVVDYLCSLTDRQVLEMAAWFSGLNLPRIVHTST